MEQKSRRKGEEFQYYRYPIYTPTKWQRDAAVKKADYRYPRKFPAWIPYVSLLALGVLAVFLGYLFFGF